jgi:hypothetical protein
MTDDIPAIGSLNPDPPQFQPRLEASVQDGCVAFKMANTPFTINVQFVPDDMMNDIIVMWMQKHPDETVNIIKILKEKKKQEADIARTLKVVK